MNVCSPTLGKLTRILAPWSNPQPFSALALYRVYIDRCISERLLLQKYAFENETVQAIIKVSWRLYLGWVVHVLKMDLG